MQKYLPARPNLDHLRRQAKSLLAALAAGERDAVATFQQFLPAGSKMSEKQVRAAGFRLADAQSAVARKSGFASWPQLARHIETLRAMEGVWSFARLEIDGQVVPPAGLGASRLLIDGDRFRMESPGSNYEGVFNVDVEAQPPTIDIEFVEGPEAGNHNHGIFKLHGDQLEICLDMTGKPAPAEFRTSPGSSRAYETLKRISNARPEAVTGGTPASGEPASVVAAVPAGFEFAPCETLTRLEGEWSARRLVLGGQELPAMICRGARRTGRKNEVRVMVGGKLTVHALVRVNETVTPVQIDYFNLAGMAPGTTQQGIMEWRGDEAWFCMAAPGQARPIEFASKSGSGNTLSSWVR
ncbi:MAG: TIGR03067 domain-containing protein [Phycisphaerae bacterium]